LCHYFSNAFRYLRPSLYNRPSLFVKSIRLAIFEDNADFRDSIIQLFRFTPGIELVGVFPDGSQAATEVKEIAPDVVLMDIDMPIMNGIDATGIIKDILPDTQVLMLTVSEEEDRIFQALRNGATGYLLKKSDPEEIVDGVRLVHKGGSPITPAIARKVLQHFRKDTTIQTTDTKINQPQEAAAEGEDFRSQLTTREREILEALVEGLSYKMIASRYYISADTVKNHIQGIYRKLHVNSKSEAIVYALKNGMTLPK
jgi:DNA-binding NarL/FixJ family response regulator